MSALRRIPEGGCILADEVGLGKTIEAGLVIAQLLAEGIKRVLLLVPKSLLRQWQTELYSLFGIEAREGQLDPDSFQGSGVFLVHRELSGGARGASILKTVDPFDLIVVDEAHEVFANLYKRFDKQGTFAKLAAFAIWSASERFELQFANETPDACADKLGKSPPRHPCKSAALAPNLIHEMNGVLAKIQRFSTNGTGIRGSSEELLQIRSDLCLWHPAVTAEKRTSPDWSKGRSRRPILPLSA